MKKLVVLIFALALFGCDFIAEQFAARGPAVVQVGETRLTLADLRQIKPGWDTLSADDQAAFLKKWVDEELLYQAAVAAKVNERPEIVSSVESAKRKIITTAYLADVESSIKVTKDDVRAYYDSHKDLFLRGKHTWSGVIVSYPKWDVGYDYYKNKKNEHFLEAPKEDYRIKSIEHFDDVLESPDTCLAADLRNVEVGTLTSFKVCNRALRSILVLSYEDSAAVKPLEDVYDEAFILALTEKRKARMEQLQLELKNKTPVFADWKPTAKEEE